MSDSFTLHDKDYVSTAEAGKRFGYTSEYITLFARTGKIKGKKIGNRWYVDVVSAQEFFDSAKWKREARRKMVSVVRKAEFRSHGKVSTRATSVKPIVAMFAISIVGLLLGATGYLLNGATQKASVIGAYGTPNLELNYQGKLTNASNVAVPDGTYNMRFWLLTSPSIATTSAVWTESLTGANRVTVQNGLFSIMLGSTSPLTSVNFNQTLFLGVEVGGTSTPVWDGEMSPRKVLGTVPASFEATRLGGLTPSQFVRTDATSTIATTSASTLLTVTQSGTGDILNLFDGSTKVFTVVDGGNVGVGTSAELAKLQVDDGYGVASGAAPQGGIVISNITAIGTVLDMGIDNGYSWLQSRDYNSATYRSLVLNPISGNVGIGATNPNARMQVGVPANAIGAMSTTLATYAGTLGPTVGNTIVAASFGFGPSNTSALGVKGYRFSNGSGYDTAAVGIGMDVDNTSYDAAGGLWFNNIGNVGIGVPNPTASKLQLIASGSGITHEKTSGGYFTSLGFSGNNPYLTYYAGNGLTIGYGASTGGAPSVDTMTLLNNGNVGIGTTTPTEKLDVNGSIGLNGWVNFSNLDSRMRITSGPGTILLGDDDNVSLSDGRLYVKNDGNVGVGTTTPSSKLTVAGNTYVAGNMTTTGALNVTGQTTFSYASGTALTVTDLYATNVNFPNAATTAGYYDLTHDNLITNGDFEATSLTGWTGFDLATTTAYSGNYAAQRTGNNQVLSNDYIPVNPLTDVLQLEGWFKKTVTGSPTPGILYFGYIAYDANKTPITTAPCGTYCYFAASGATIANDGAWHKYSATTYGEGTAHPNFPVGTKFIRVLILINYAASANEVTLADHITLKRVNYGPLFVGNNFNTTNMVDQNQLSKLFTTATNAFTLQPTAGGSLVVASSTGAALFTVSGNGNVVTTGQTTLLTASSTGLTVTGGTYLATVSGNVGIGTTDPQAKLQINGAADATTGLADARVNSALFARGWSGSSWGTAIGHYNQTGDHYIQVMDQAQTATKALLLQPWGGNVGIGTTTSTHMLTLAGGDIDFTRGDTSAIRRLGEISFDWTGGSYDTASYHGIQSKDEGGNFADDMRLNSFSDIVNTIDSNGNDANSRFVIQKESTTNGTDLFTVDESGSTYISGNVGIGTTTPSSKLTVLGDITSSGSVYWGNGSGTRTETKNDAGAIASKSGFFETASPVNYYSGASSWQHLIEARHSNDSNNYAMQIAGSFFDQELYFRKTNNSSSTVWNKFIYENSAGNVGIGTLIPTEKLDVNGVVRISPSVNTGILAFGNRETGSGYYDTGVYRGAIGSIAAGNNLNIAGYEGIAFNSQAAAFGSQATRMYINGTSGNVGIGTTSPGQKLTVAGNISLNDNNTQIQEGDGNSVRVQTDSGYVEIGPQNATWAHFQTDRSKFYFNKQIDIDGNLNNYGGYYLLNQSGSSYINGGNVGIGTTTPGQKLSVVGNISAEGARPITINPTSGNITIQADPGGWANFLHFKGSGGTDRGGFGALGSGDALSYLYVGDSYLNPTQVWKNGSVGIGTDNPGAKLDVAGDIKFTGGDLMTGAITLMKPVYILGGGANEGNGRMVKIGNDVITSTAGRGLSLCIITAASHTLVSCTIYDTYGDGAASTNLATALNNLTRAQIGILTSYDAWELNVTDNLRTAARRLGLFKLGSYSQGGSRRPYAAMFYGSGTATGNTEPGRQAIEVMESDDADAPAARIVSWMTEDGFAGHNMPNALVSANSQTVDPVVLVSSSGNVGIGTTNPFSKTTISKAGVGALTTADATNNAHLTLAGTDSLVRLQFGTMNTGSYAGMIQASFDNGGGDTGVEPLSLNPLGGNVGIGTTTPSQKLSVIGGGIALNTANTVLADAGDTSLRLTTASGYIDLGPKNSSYAHIYTDRPAFYTDKGMYIGNNNSFFNTSSGNSYIAASGGNVGIGSTVSQSKLQVWGSSAPLQADPAGTETILTLTREGSPNVWREGASFALGRWQTGVSSAPYSRLDIKLKQIADNFSLPDVTVMTLQDNGNVGIGTTNPGSKLQITGAGAGYPTAGATTNTGLLLTNTDTSYGLFMGVAPSGNAWLQAQRSDGGADLYNMILNPNGGNVGIGMTGPGTKLDVLGVIRANNTDIDPNDIGAGVAMGNIHDTTTGWSAPGIGFGPSSGNMSAIVAGAGTMYFGMESGSVNTMSSKMTLTNGGNLSATGYVNGATGLYTGGTSRVDSSGNLVNIGTITQSGNATVTANAYTTYGPNTSWSSYLRVGGNGRTVPNSDEYASIVTTNGNVHIDAGTSRSTYLNYYSGTGGVIFGNGANGTNANVSAAGAYTGTSLNVGSGAITSGLINGQTISNAANFTGTVALNGVTTLNNTNLEMNRVGFARNGISWYSPSYTAWSEYMAQAGQTNVGPHGDITAPAGSLVTTWGMRNFIENVSGYGWTFESGASTGQPSVVAEIRSSDGTIRSAGSIIGSSGINTGAGAGTQRIDASGNLVNIGTISSGAITSGLINGQTISSAANFTGTVGVATSVTIGAGLSGRKLDVFTAANNGDGLSIGQDADNTQTIQTYIDNQWTNRVTYASGCCNGLKLNPDVGYVSIGSSWSVDHGGNMTGVGTITSGLINGQTISSAANFTGTLNVNGAITGNSKQIFNTGDAYLRINETGAFGNGIWMGPSNFAGSSGIFSLGSNGGTTNSRVYINGGTYNGNNVIAIDGSNGHITATQFNGSGAGLTGTAGSLTAGATNFINAPDGDRDAATKLPTTSGHGVRYDFVNSASAGTGGNYAGLMTYAPWDGTTVSTGDASYQLAFGSTAANGGGVPQLNIRKGIDSTWNSWYTLIHSGNTSLITGVGTLTSGSIASGFGTITTANTITGTTINGTTGINTGAGAGTQRIDASGNLANIGTITSGLINGQTISSSANFTGSLTVNGGGTVTGGPMYFKSNKGAASYVGANDTYTLQAFSDDAGAAGLSFHRGGYYAVNMGLDPDNVLRIGGWSAPANLWQFDMNGNETIAGSFTGLNYKVTSGNGYGLCFWADCTNYKISMGNSGEYQYGPVTDYSIKNTMSSTAGRGWTWGLPGATPIAALDNTGKLAVANDITSATYISDKTGKLARNLLDTSSWTIGTGGVGSFGCNGSSAGECERVWGTDPFGRPTIVWTGTNDAASDSDGGWNYNNIPVDNNKAYRSIVWFKKDNTSGTFYYGLDGGNTLNLSGGVETNPYFFAVGNSNFVADRWYLAVGYIHAANDASVIHHSAIYDSVTGQKVITGTDYKNRGANSLQTHRTYNYYDTTAGAKPYFWGPRFEEINGNEPSIESLLGQYKGATLASDSYFGSNVGIGIANAIAALTIKPSNNAAQLRLLQNNDSTAGYSLFADSNGGDLLFSRHSSSLDSEKIRFTASGSIGIGTSTPAYKLAVTGAAPTMQFYDTNQNRAALFGMNDGYNAVVDTVGGTIILKTNGTTWMTVGNGGLATTFDYGKVGIGTATPSTKLHVLDTVGSAQLQVAYDATRFSTLQVDASGNLTISASNGNVTFSNDNLKVCQGGACPTSTATSTAGNLFVENAVTIGDGFSLRQVSATELGLYNASGSMMVIFDNGN